MVSSIYYRYSESFPKYEFTSGNLNSIKGCLPALEALTNLLYSLLFIIFPLKNYALIILIALNKFRKYDIHNLACDNYAVTISSKDIYFGNRFLSLPGFQYIHVNGRSDIDVPLSIYYFLNFKNIILYIFFLPLMLIVQFVLAFKILRYDVNLNEKINFLNEVAVELSSGTYLTGRFIDFSFCNVFKNIQIRNLVLPFEGRNWEKRIFSLAKEYNINTIAIIHSAITSCNKSAYDYNLLCRAHIPNYIMTPGKYFTEILIRYGWPNEKVVTSNYLRGIMEADFKDANPRIIFSLTGNLHLSKLILQRICTIKDPNNLIFISLNNRAASYSELVKLTNNLKLTLWDKSLSKTSILLTSSTSHFLEFLHKRIKTLPYSFSESHCQPGFDLPDDPIRNLTLDLDYISSYDSISLYEHIESLSCDLDPSFFFNLEDQFTSTINGLLK